MMKKTTLLLCCTILSLASFAQVGIGTDTPQGILDIDSSTMGFVYPSAALNSTIDPSPVQNPQGGLLAVGTTIFNTNDTNTGLNDVEPGIYAWNGSRWVTHFYKQESEIFEQTSDLRTSSYGIAQQVPGLSIADANVFIPKYTGTYKMEMRGYFGAGSVRTNRGMHTVIGKGDYLLNFNGTVYSAETKAFSSYHPNASAYTNIVKETAMIHFVDLVAGTPYPLHLSFLQTTTSDNRAFNGRARTGGGRGYLGTQVPCSVQFTYLENQ